jgi:UDP-2,3-diacylglucosamine hydrolase
MPGPPPELFNARPLGILAGGGSLPVDIAARVTAGGRAVHIVGIGGEAETGITKYPHEHVAWGRIGRLLASFRQAGCRDLIIVGSVTRPDLASIRPDFGLLRSLPTFLALIRAGGDDSLLRKVVKFFEAQGFHVRGVADVAPDLLADDGVLCGAAPSHATAADITLGFRLVEALGPADVGQAVVIHAGQVLAIEAAEGTDRMLKRLAGLRAQGSVGGVLVKRPKPRQELRIDLPAIGPRTVQGVAAAALAGIGIEANRVLIADRRETVAKAANAGVFITGVTMPRNTDARMPRQDRAQRTAAHVTAVGHLTPKKRHLADIARGLETLQLLAPFAASAGVVVSRHHVLAIETGEGLEAMLARVAGLRQWGGTANTRRQGVLAVPALGPAPDWLLGLAANAGLAGVVVSEAGAQAQLARAGQHGIFLATAVDVLR